MLNSKRVLANRYDLCQRIGWVIISKSAANLRNILTRQNQSAAIRIAHKLLVMAVYYRFVYSGVKDWS